VPKLKGINTHDDRELGIMVYHLYVGEADALGTVPQVVDAGPVAAPDTKVAAGAAGAPKAAPAKATPPASPGKSGSGKSAS
jgi:hypothetical protein